MFITEENFIEEKEIATELFNNLIQNYQFDSFITCRASFYEWENSYRKKVSKNHLHFSSGVCRAIIINDNHLEYVYKFNLKKESIDYCANEAAVYSEAEKRGLANAFIPVIPLITLNTRYEDTDYSLNIYLVPFCKTDSSRLSDECYSNCFDNYCSYYGYNKDDLTSEQMDRIRDEIGDEYSDGESMLELASNYWEHNFWIKVNQFIDEMGINDLHCGNWGFWNGELIITDYAGYNKVVGGKIYA